MFVKQFLLFTSFYILISGIGFSQDQLDCLDKVYSYYERDAQDYLIHKCSSQSTPNVAKVKQQMPFYLCVDDYYLNPVSSSVYRNICDEYDFSNKFMDALESAINEWNSICPSGEVDFQISEEPNCTGEIEAILSSDMWTSNYNGSKLDAVSQYAEAFPGGRANDGTVRAPRIILNFTRELSEFIDIPGTYRQGRVWAFNGQCSQHAGQGRCNDEDQYDKVCLSVRTILLHELGHILGLGHPNSSGCNGTLPSTMDNSLNLAEDFDQHVELSDKCAIKNIYCPSALSYINYIENMTDLVSLYPNPSKYSISIKYPSSWSIDVIKIYDSLGELTYISRDIQNVGYYEIADGVLSNGVNFLVLETSNMAIVKTIYHE
jgi:hypothetical protein